MARQEIKWRSNNGNLYLTEVEALQKDKELEQVNEMYKIFKRGTVSLHEIVSHWDKFKKIMEEDQ